MELVALYSVLDLSFQASNNKIISQALVKVECIIPILRNIYNEKRLERRQSFGKFINQETEEKVFYLTPRDE